ncbi:hypothetical protein [Rossellomorea yichunensis]|uniref:hypothetical protein n=1 Tax=Rossellomorea yichunensis TaxID=3077331 RepID=UPI0028E6D6F6|nr:hypothetical protein [Rossellomorea sp. YC4-1]
MFPTKDELKLHFANKMTNQDVAKKYGISFQKVIQLGKEYELEPGKLRETNKYVVYEHWHNEEVVYVGSGLWYRARRYTNRRNMEHRELMKEGKIEYKFVGEFEKMEDARVWEYKLINKYKQKGQAKFNKQQLSRSVT